MSSAAGDGKANEVKLDEAPTDGISSLVFANASDNLMLAASWDKSVRLYDVSRNKMLRQYDHKAAVLDVAFNDDDSCAFSGGIDRQLIM
jgi:cell cycle arrest protein BUB3